MRTRIKKILVLILIVSLSAVQMFQSAFPNEKYFVNASEVIKPVCIYRFNNSLGTSEIVIRDNDTAEGSNVGTIPDTNNSVSEKYADGISGNGIYLDGTYGLKLYPKLSGTEYTVSFWVKPDEERLYSNILYAGEGMLTEKERYFNITSDDISSPAVISSSHNGGYYIGNGQKINAGKWSCICMTVSGENAKVYVNGSLQTSGQILGNICGKDTNYYLGIDCYNIPFKGCIDNVAFYDTSLSESMVNSIYNNENSENISEKVTGISLNKNSLSLSDYGSKALLYADIEPESAKNQNVIWKSSNEKVASVKNGVITSLKNGKSVITATTEDGNFKAECTVTVGGISELKAITMKESNVTLEGDGSSIILEVIPNPENAYIPELKWTSSDSNIAIVGQDGHVFSVANGSADIKAQTAEGDLFAVCHVTVQGVSHEVAVQSIEFTEDSIKLDKANNKHQLVTVIKPESAANQECVYYSEDNSVAVIDDSGMVKAVGNGTANVCAMSNDGRFIAECTVKVTGFADTAIKKIELDNENIEVARGETGYLYVQTTPVTATEVLDWSSNNPDSVEVVADEYGRSAEVIVYEDAVMGSTAMITVSSETGASAECFVQVTEYGVKNIKLEHKSLYMLPGESYEMDTEITPETAENAEIIWKSNNKNVAVVDDKGVIRVLKEAKAGQEAVITSSNIAQTKKSKCKVIVKGKKVKIKKLSTTRKNISLYPGQKADMAVKYAPLSATDVKLTYTSKNPDIVKVSGSGKISVPAGYRGTAEVTITAKSNNGKKVTSVVKVKQKKVKIKKLSISKSVLDLYEGNNTTLYVNYKPANATQSNIKWSSSNSAVKVTGRGRSASLRVGNISSRKTVTVKAKDVNGATASCQVSVYPKSNAGSSGGSSGSGNLNNNDTGNSSSGNNSKPDSNGNNDKPSGSTKPAVQKIKKLSFGSNGYVFIKRGKGKNLKNLLTISPTGAVDDLVWKCSNKYASVNNSGYVSISGKAQKNTNISVLVYSKGDSSVKAALIINVTT